ncbi:MAG: hypothetical protein ACYCO9_14010 [Streptosporangiaceae bacterium]
MRPGSARRRPRGRCGYDPAAMLAALTADLHTAAASARRLHHALDNAQNHLTWAAAGP